MAMWRKSDGSFRWLLLIGLLQLPLVVNDLATHGFSDVRWLGRMCLAIACFAAVPLDDPRYRGLPWARTVFTPNGIVAIAGFTASIAILLGRIVTRSP